MGLLTVCVGSPVSQLSGITFRSPLFLLRVPEGVSTKYDRGVSAVEVTLLGMCLLSVVIQTLV